MSGDWNDVLELDGRKYARLVTEDGLNTVLVDPETGEAVAWIPSPAAFGAPTTVVRTRETVAGDAENRRNLSLTELHRGAVVRDVTATELARAIAEQYPRGLTRSPFPASAPDLLRTDRSTGPYGLAGIGSTMEGGGTVSRIFGVRALAITGVMLALGATVLLAPGRASAAHEDCALVVNPPVNYGNIFALSSASVECASVKRVIHFSLVLTVDGTIADSSDRTCHRRADCSTYTVVNDGPGDQVWCTTASARVGGHSLGPVTRCETETIP